MRICQAAECKSGLNLGAANIGESWGAVWMPEINLYPGVSRSTAWESTEASAGEHWVTGTVLRSTAACKAHATAA